MERETYYLTTPIYYPSGRLTIGNSYTTVVSDAIARYQRMRGKRVMFLTGTDEHGQKLQQAAAQRGLDPQAYVDGMVAEIKRLWQLLNISHDRFIRTTDEHHVKAVQTIFQKLYDQGDIYLGEYSGHYCTPCESFWTESQLDEGKCPDCHRDVQEMKESCYFLRLSKYQDRLLRHIEAHPDFIQPASRANEMINNFLKPGLEDLAVSRTTFKWGVPVPFDPEHVVYVWLDALTNYITALGYPEKTDDLRDFWPAQLQLVGKDIIRFHTIIWPIVLMALDLPLPDQVFGHGWLLMKGGKLSKSKLSSDEEKFLVDPVVLSELYGVDAIRYFLLREIAFGSDGNFSNEALISRINSDLANDLGNLLSRTVAMIEKYFPQGLPAARAEDDLDRELQNFAARVVGDVEKNFADLHLSTALQTIWELIGRCNKYIDETTPWVLAKDSALQPRLAEVLYQLADALVRIAVMIAPFMPHTSDQIFVALGLAQSNSADSSSLDWNLAHQVGVYPRDAKVRKIDVLFPRIDEKESLINLRQVTQRLGLSGQADEAKDQFEQEPQNKPAISFTRFGEMELRVGRVLACEKVENTERLLKLDIDLGFERRTVVSGIAAFYSPQDLIGKNLVLIVNLEPRKIRGIESKGMILSAEQKDGSLHVLIVDDAIEAGAEIA